MYQPLAMPHSCQVYCKNTRKMRKIIGTVLYNFNPLLRVQSSLEKTCEDLKSSLTETTEQNSALKKEIQDLNATLDGEKGERKKVCDLLP